MITYMNIMNIMYEYIYINMVKMNWFYEQDIMWKGKYALFFPLIN